jgi:hypothetical protein
MPEVATGRRELRRPPLLVFVHIPKTAGTTLTSILNLNEPGMHSRAIANVFKGGGGTKEDARFRRLHSDETENIMELRVVHGHFPLGMRRHFPKRLPKRREVRYFTFLREPTDRMLSHFFAIRDSREDLDPADGEPRGARPLAPDATLEEALDGGYLHDNLQTRMLSGLVRPFRKVNSKMLDRAKENLREELACFGLTERFDESLVLAKRRLGLRSILYSQGHDPSRRKGGRVNTARPRGDAVPAELRETAERANRYDIELYRYALELFDEIEERHDIDFQVELAALQAVKVGAVIEDLELSPPAGYDAGEAAWRMLVQAEATSLRREHQLAETWAVAYELAHDDPAVQIKLSRIKEMQAAGGGGEEPSRKTRRKAVRAMRRAAGNGNPAPERRPKARARRTDDDG